MTPSWRTQLTALGLSYAAGIGPKTSVWPPGTGPLPAPPGKGIGRPPKLLRRDQRHQPISVKALALNLPAKAWQTITGARAPRTGCRRASPAACAAGASRYRAERAARREWLLIEWPQGEAEPTKYWLATLAEEISFEGLVDFAKLRWRTERDYQELKQELGLGDYEGRGWRGFHHHATLCIAAYGFLIAEREPFPPQHQVSARSSRDLSFPRVIDPEAPPIRPERHIPNSIITVRRRLIVALARTLPRCPCCNAPIRKIARIPDY